MSSSYSPYVGSKNPYTTNKKKDEEEDSSDEFGKFKPAPQFISQDEETPPVRASIQQRQPSAAPNASGTGRRWSLPKFKCSNLFDTKMKLYAWGAFVVILVIAGITILATSLEKVESTEYGLQYNVHSKVSAHHVRRLREAAFLSPLIIFRDGSFQTFPTSTLGPRRGRKDGWLARWASRIRVHQVP